MITNKCNYDQYFCIFLYSNKSNAMIMASRFTQACIVQSFFFSLGLMLKIFFFLLAFSPCFFSLYFVNNALLSLPITQPNDIFFVVSYLPQIKIYQTKKILFLSPSLLFFVINYTRKKIEKMKQRFETFLRCKIKDYSF